MSLPRARPLGGHPSTIPYMPPTREQLFHVRGNFCNLRDPLTERVLYDPALAGYWASAPDTFARLLNIHRQNGTTHIVIGPFEGGEIYPGAAISNPDFLSNLPQLHEYVRTLVTTPAADGLGFRVIVQLDGGGPSPRQRIHAHWAAILDTLREYTASIIVSPGWELIHASEWSSADYSYALKTLYTLRLSRPWFPIAAHLSPGRSAWSSNPVEVDDPAQGAEAECWVKWGGEHVDVFLYQAEPPDPRDNPEGCRITFSGVQLVCSQHTAPDGKTTCWLDRTWDSLLRIGAGQRGWRKIPWVLFEHVAFPCYHFNASPEWARTTATQVQHLATHLGVSIGFCNGLPKDQ